MIVAVIAALAGSFVLGGIGCSLIVGGAYEKALDKARATGACSLVGPLLCLAVITITNAWLLRALGIHGPSAAIGVGLIVGVGYLLPVILNIAINPLFPRPFLYSAINALLFVIGCCINCLVLTLV